jgi:hypothetical protein
MKFLFILAALLIVPSSWGQTSYVPTTRLLREKGYQLNLGADYFSTQSTVDDKGKATKLPGGSKFARTQGDVNGYYGAADNFQIGLGMRFRQNQSTFYDGQNVQHTPSQGGIQSTMLSLMYSFKPVGKLQYTLEGMFRYTPYTNENVRSKPNRDNIILGDDGNEYSGGLGVTYSSESNNYYTFRGGLRRPGKDLSSEFYYQAEAALAWRTVALVAGIDGLHSLGTSPYGSFSDSDRPVFNSANTNLYNSVNREWITPYIGVNVALSKYWRVEFRGSQVVQGRSTDLGTGFGIQLIRRVDKAETKAIDSKFKTYDLEVTVTKISKKKAYIVIDRGLSGDVNKGMIFDFFEFDYTGGNVLVARGVVIRTKADSSIVKITQRYNTKKDIKEGLIGRAYYR